MFLAPLGYDNVVSLIDNGFDNYKTDKLYEYGIKDVSILYDFTLYSTKEEYEFVDKYWDNFTKDVKSREEFLKAKTQDKRLSI